MVNTTKLEKLIGSVGSESASVDERRKSARALFHYVQCDIPSYLKLKNPQVKFKFGSYDSFKTGTGWKKVAATAYYAQNDKAIFLNERIVILPYSGMTYSQRLAFNSGQAIAIAIAHEIGHTFDLKYNDYGREVMLEQGVSYLNNKRIAWRMKRRLVESIAEMIAAAYITSRAPSFDYNKLPPQVANDEQNLYIYGCAASAGKGIIDAPEKKRAKILRGLILSRTPKQKFGVIKKLGAYYRH